MLQIYPKLITDALATVRYPGTGKNLVEANMIEDDLRIDGMNVSFSIIFEKSTDPFMKSVVKAAEAAIHTYVDKDVNVTVKTKTIQAARPEPGKMLPQVKTSLLSVRARAALAKAQWLPIWLWHWRRPDIRSDCSTPTSLALLCQKCSTWRTRISLPK